MKFIEIISFNRNYDFYTVIFLSVFRMNLGYLTNIRWIDESIVCCFRSLNIRIYDKIIPTILLSDPVYPVP